MILIGLGHRARQGKSYAAARMVEFACEVHPEVYLDAGIYSVGDEIQRWCEQRGMIPPGKSRKKLTPHELSLLGKYGWSLRQEYEDYWIDLVFNRIGRDKPAIALIPNIRYPNEAHAVLAAGGVNVLVERFNADGSPFIAPDRDPNFPSETSMCGWNWNYRLSAGSGQLDWLTAQAKALLSVLVDASGHSHANPSGVPCQLLGANNLSA